MGKLAWCVPPILGFLAFAAMKARTPAAEVDSETLVAAEVSLVHAAPSEVVSAVERAEHEQKAAAAASARIFPDDDEALKAEFVKFRQRLLSFHASKNWPAYNSHYERYHQMGLELGRRLGTDAKAWILEVEPACLVWVMEGWAETDPTGAFQELAGSDRHRPCSEELLIKLIEAQKDGAGMKAAVHEVPWHLFDGMVYHPSLDGSTTEGREAHLPQDANFGDWIESGAARAMAENGVQFRLFFFQWAKQDPGQALAHWETWPDERPQAAKARLIEILQATSQDDALVARVRAAWEKMPAEEQDEISGVFEDYRKSIPREWSDPNDRLNQAFQFLVPDSTTPSSE
jgi:hypothetical protein